MSERVKGRVGARVGTPPYKTHVLQYPSPLHHLLRRSPSPSPSHWEEKR